MEFGRLRSFRIPPRSRSEIKRSVRLRPEVDEPDRLDALGASFWNLRLSSRSAARRCPRGSARSRG
jgi:hypothetical protein